MSIEPAGLIAGAGTCLVRMAGDRLAVEADRDRCLALLSVVCRRSLGAEVLHPIVAAAAYWAAGDKAMANLRLAVSRLPTLGSAADADRLAAAAWCLDQCLTPRELMKALGFDPMGLDLRKYDPDQPRVPAGSGRKSGRWTDENDDDVLEGRSSSSPEPSPSHVAASDDFTPGGIAATPSDSVDPLDPAGLNKVPPTPEEQQAIVDTLNIIALGNRQDIKRLRPHPYRNLPAILTGAKLPPEPQGYTAYDVVMGDSASRSNRGAARVVLNAARDNVTIHQTIT